MMRRVSISKFHGLAPGGAPSAFAKVRAHARFPIIWPLISNFAFSVFLLSPASDASATELKRAIVSYASAGQGAGDGYENAQVAVEYQTLNCMGEITIAARRVKGSVKASDWYWYEGARVAARAAAPTSPLVPFSGRLMSGGSVVGRFSMNVGDALGMGCFTGDTRAVAKLSDWVAASSSPVQINAFIIGLRVVPDITSKPLINAAVEQAVRDEKRNAAREAAAAEQQRKAQLEREAQERRAAELRRQQAQKAAQARSSQENAGSGQGDEADSPRAGTPRKHTEGPYSYARSTDGGFYRRSPDGRVAQISRGEYEAAQTERAREQAAELKAENQKRAAAELDRLNSINQQRQLEAERTSRQIDQAAQNFAESYYAGQAVRESLGRMNNLASLGGNYNSEEELEAEFRRRSEALNREYANLEQSQRAGVEAVTKQYFHDTDPAVQNFMGMVGQVMAQNEREDARRAAKQKLEQQRQQRAQELEQQRQQLAREMEAKRKAQKIAMRKSVVANFPEGDVPLSSHRVNTDTLYFFAYSLNQSAIEQDHPQLVATETFPVHRRGLGLWPFKYAIKDQIPTGPDKNTLVGYFATQALAERTRNSFIELARDSGFVIKEVAYAGPNPPAQERALPITEGAQSHRSFGGLSDEELWGGANSAANEDDYW